MKSEIVERCEVCRFWRGLLGVAPGGPPFSGICRRRSPLNIPSPHEYQVDARFPHAISDEWCGEFEERPPVPAPPDNYELTLRWRADADGNGIHATLSRAGNVAQVSFHPKLELHEAMESALTQFFEGKKP